MTSVKRTPWARSIGFWMSAQSTSDERFHFDARNRGSRYSGGNGDTILPHVRLHVPERTLTTWIVLDVSPSMAFGTAQRLKADVAEGVALVLGNLAVRRAGRVAMMTFGAGRPRLQVQLAGRAGRQPHRVAVCHWSARCPHARPSRCDGYLR